MDIVVFGRALSELTIEDIRAVAADLAATGDCAASEIAGTRAVLTIEQALRRAHRVQNAAAAALVAVTSVQDAAQRADVTLPDADVTRVARAAAQFARGLVIADSPGVDDALRTLGRGWQRLECCAEYAAA